MAHPPRLTLAGLLLGFLLFVAPSEANQCRTGCHGINVNKAYREGRTYTYQLDGESTTSVTDGEGEAKFKLNAIVELLIKPDCVHQIKLKNVKLNGVSASQGEIEKHALQFNYHDGHIDTEVCAEAGDTQTSLNVKRAVISLFQDAVIQDDGSTTHSETDVFGGCPTDFTFSKNGEARTIKKYRNLEQCSYRENIKQDLISATFNSNSNVKSTPLLDSELKVEQQFNHGVLSKAISVETYKFKPFRNGDSGAETVVETKLTFKGESGAGSPAQVSQPKSLVFDAPHQVVRSSVEAITKALQVAKESMPDAVTQFSARRFAELIKVLRLSSERDISAVYSRVKSGGGSEKDSTRKLFLDALFRTGTGEAAEALVALVKKNELTEIETIIYYTSLAFIRHANLPSIKAAASLLDEPNLPRIGYLGIGSLIGKYCEEHECENVREVNEALAKISSKLVTATTRKGEDAVISALKGLGNARYLDDATLLKIAGIATEKNNHNRVRVAALEALPTRCSMEWKQIIFSTLADRNEDSEIRIKAYLSLVACPCPHVANKLKEVLDKETINQVGSFITSHLRNLRASTNPDKEEAKHQLGLIKPRTKFPEDFRKFSFNNELSYAIDAFGVGSSVESNVIYSQNSFVPRSMSLNLTTEMFGRSFNLLQLDGRVENLDRLIEEYVGPKGYLRTDNLKNVVVDGKKTYDKIFERIKNRLEAKLGRHRRQVSQNEIANFGKQIHLPDTELNDDVELDLSIKLFGAELAFLSYQRGQDKFSPQTVVDQLFNILEDGLETAKNFDYHFKNHLHFLDAELIYPTGLGFPLTLGVTGTSAVHLKTSGKIDLLAIYKNPGSTSVEIGLEPSASIRIAGSLIIEGCGIESGLKVVHTLHSSTATELTVKLLGGTGVDLNVGILKPKQELISVTSEVLISSGPKGDNYVAPKFAKATSYADCFDQLAGSIGMTLCGSISHPYNSVASAVNKALSPLSGPFSASLYLQTNDVRNYHFKAYYNTANPHARSFEIVLETPNSRTDRRISVIIEGALEPEKRVKIALDSPWKKASVEGILKTNTQEQTLTITVHHDTVEYFVRGGIVANGNKYKPVLEYKVPDHVEKLAGVKNGVKNTQRNGQQYTVGGDIEIANNNGGKKYILNKVVLASDGKALITVDGNAAVSSASGNADLKIDYGGDVYVLNGNLAVTNPYNFKTDLSLVATKNKQNSFSISFERKGTQSEGNENLIIVHGSDLTSKTNRFEYYGEHVVKYKSPQDFDLSTERLITYPPVNLKGRVDVRLTPKTMGYIIECEYAKFSMASLFSIETGILKPGDYKIEFKTQLQANSIDFKTQREIFGEHKNKFTASLALQPGGQYEIVAVIDHDMKPDNINSHLNAELKVNGKKILLETGLEANPNLVNSRAIVNYESTKYLDFTVTIHRGDNPNGNLKVNLKNYFTADGNFKYQQGRAGDAHIEINIPKFNRKIKGNGEISIVGSKHNANAELLYDAAKDLKKRIKIVSENDFTSTSFDSKNNIDVLDYHTVINAKGTTQGEINNGKQTAEFDVTLPNGRYIVGKGNRAVTKQNELMDGKMEFELIDHVTKGGKSRKFIYNPEVHKLNIREKTFEAKHDLKLINFDGDDIKLVLTLKNLPNGADKRAIGAQFDLTGSKIPQTFTLGFDIDAENEGAYGSGNVRSSLGSKVALQVNGNYVRGNNVDKPMTAETSIRVKLPSDKLKSISLDISDTILIPKEAGGRFELISKSQLTYNDDKTIKFDSHLTSSGIAGEGNVVEGTGKATVSVLSNPPVTLGYNYKHIPGNDLNQAALGFNLNYGDQQTSIAVDSGYSKTLNVFNLNVKATTPIEKARNIDVKLQHKNSGAVSGAYGKIPLSAKTDITLVLNQARHTYSNEYELSDEKVKIHTIVTAPEGKTENTINLNKLSDREFSGDYKLASPKGSLDIDYQASLTSVDDFSITLNVDTDQVKTRNIHVEIANKLAKAGKRIMITVTAAGKNIITGSTNYKKHTEGSKVIIEGNGSLKVYDDTKTSSFKYTHQKLVHDADGESGISTLLNFNFGQSNIVAEFKLTEKELHILNSYCEQKADCAQLILQAKVTNTEFKQTEETTIEGDLRKFNVPYEFGFKSNRVTDLKTGYDHTTTLYLHSANKKSQYGSQIYAHPTESGIVLSLPSRELALISTLELPKNKRSGAYKLDVSAYLDRRGRPKEKTSLTVTGDAVVDKNSGSFTGESRFSYPSHSKDLIVKGKLQFGGAHLLDGNLDIDIFENRNQKIVVTTRLVKTPINQGYNITGAVTVTSPGQQLNVRLDEHVAYSNYAIGYGSLLSYDDKDRKPKSAGVLFYADAKEAYLRIHSPDEELLKAEARLDLAKNLQKLTTDVTLFGRDPVHATLEVRDVNSFKYLYQTKNNAKNRFEANGRFLLGQVAEVRADSYKNGAKKELLRVVLHLDERQYLKPDLAFNKDNIAAFIDAFRTRVVEVFKLAQEFLNDMTLEIADELKDLLNHLKTAQPNLRPLVDHFVTQLTQLKNELNIESQTIKQIGDKLNAIFAGPITAVNDALKKIGAQYEELQKVYADIIERLNEAYKSTLPELKKSWKAISAALNEIFEEVATIVTGNIKNLINLINTHKEEFRQIIVLASELLHDVTAIAFKAALKIQTEIKEFFTVLVAELKALPITEFVQEKYKELLNINVANVIIRSLDDVVVSVKRLLPTKALEDLVTSVYDYVVAHLRQEKVDEAKELKKLYIHTLEAIQSIIAIAQTYVRTNDFADLFQSRLPFDISGASKLPGISSLKVSLVSLLGNGELPTPLDVFLAYRPSSDPDEDLEFRKLAVFLDGGHFFTFDGRHLTYPGKCNYVLAQDGRDGNFSVVAELNDGKLNSVTITEPTESITIKSNGGILVNNKAADFPASTKNLHAYIHGSYVEVNSDYGVELVCSSKAPLICKLYVSGFYHGRVRGILGNGNNEPWDDYLLPSGKVTESETELGQSYKLGAQCPNVQSVHTHGSARSSQCTEFFTGGSPLRTCFTFVDPSPYREACEHAAAAGAQKEGACLIAAAYYSVCRDNGIFVNIPTTCGSCQVGKQKIDIGDTFSTQYPKNQADVVIVLEQATENNKIYNELIVPLIALIKTELKDQGITDVRFGLIGYGDQLENPQHFTLNGSPNVDAEVKNIKFTNRNPTITLEEARAGDLKKKLEFLGQKVEVELGTFKLTSAYEEALAYDFRPGAARTIVGVIATPCEKSLLPISLQQVRLLLGYKAYSDLGATYNQIAMLDDILISGKAVKNVVGFDADSVFTFADSKKKPIEGSTELRKNMVVASGDVCATFAANSGGAAFSAHNFLEAKPQQKHQFLQVTARRLVSGLVNTEIRSDCVCRQEYGVNPRPSCRIVSRKEKEPIARPTKKGTKG